MFCNTVVRPFANEEEEFLEGGLAQWAQRWQSIAELAATTVLLACTRTRHQHPAHARASARARARKCTCTRTRTRARARESTCIVTYTHTHTHVLTSFFSSARCAVSERDTRGYLVLCVYHFCVQRAQVQYPFSFGSLVPTSSSSQSTLPKSCSTHLTCRDCLAHRTCA